MLKIENVETFGWEAAIRGMRNPMNSWEKSDSEPCYSKCECAICPDPIGCDLNVAYCIGSNDLDLITRLRNAGTDHRKFMRMITVYVDITAPLYWWKEFDTYKVGTVANSCSTMHKIAAKPFAKEDFSYEHLCKVSDTLMTDFNEFIGIENKEHNSPYRALNDIIEELNQWRDFYIYYKNKPTEDIENHNENLKTIWWQMIQLLPSSYNQRRTVMLNYEVLTNIYKSRKNHKLDEWCVHDKPKEYDFSNKDFSSGMWGFCDWIENLPYSVLITGGKSNA